MLANTEQPKRGRPRKMKKILFRRKTTSKQVICYDQVKSGSQKRKRVTNDGIYHNDKVKSEVMKRAEEVQANLATEFPSMIKYMLPSHVSGGFWLGLPKQFCYEHMPQQDTMIVLEDESGTDYQTRYLAAKVGLSGGWRGFSIAHNLQAGDVVVFQLVRPTTFKVYIVRVNGSEEVDVALGLLKLDAYMRQLSHENLATHCEEIEELEPLLMDAIHAENPTKHSEEIVQSEPLLMCNPEPNLVHFEYESKDLGIDVLDGIRLSDSVIDFNEVKSFEDFEIQINGLVMSSQLSKHLLSKYYDLCSSKKSFLHENLLGGINCKLAIGVISETINIADAIRASKLTNADESFATWEKTLRAFRMLGMNVDFMLERLDQLTNLAVTSRSCKQLKSAAQEEVRALEAKILEIKEAANRLEVEIQQLENNYENYELMFQEVAKAPW